MKICRQSIYWKPKRTMLKMDRIRYAKLSDEDVLEEIRVEKKDRPTYGYKRITEMINRTRTSKGLQRYNRKRIERVMSMNGLLQVKNNSKYSARFSLQDKIFHLICRKVSYLLSLMSSNSYESYKSILHFSYS